MYAKNRKNRNQLFFSILLKENIPLLSVLIIVMALSLTISTVDTLVNAISSLVVVEGKYFFVDYRNNDFLKLFLKHSFTDRRASPRSLQKSHF